MAAQITALTGTPPSRSDPVNFAARGDSFLGQLPDFQSQANVLAAEAEANALLAETKRNEASVFASNASTSASAAASSFDSFDDRYLGPKASAPTLDNDGQTLLVGALYFDTTLNRMRVRNNANNAWLDAYYTDENLTVTNLEYTNTLTGGTGVINIGSGQLVKTVGGNIGIGAPTPTSLGAGTIGATINGAGGGHTTYQYGAANTGYVIAQPGGLVVNTFTGKNLQLGTAGATRLEIDTNGNAALGSVPSAWVSFKALDVNTYGSVASATNRISLAANSYFDGSVYRYKTTGQASRFDQIAGDSQWFTASSGTAGTPITYIQRMTLFQAGQLSLGRTDVQGKLTVETANASETVGYFRNSASDGVIQLNSNTSASRIKTLSGGGLTFGTDNTAGDSEGFRLTSGRYFKASNTGSYGSVAGYGDLSANLSHTFQSNDNNATVAALNGNTGAVVTNYSSALATGAAGRHFQGNLNGVEVFKVLANGSVEGQTEAPGTNSTLLASTAFVKNAVDSAALGVGQTWQDVTGSRAAGVNYTNTTGRPIAISVFGPNGNAFRGIIVAGVRVNTLTPIGTGSIASSVFAVVPDGTVYSLETGSTVSGWTELR